jgi:hypothetical protein
MVRIQERIPKDRFEKIFRPMIRAFGSRDVIIRLNEEARTAIPRQTKLAQLMPKLLLLCYEQNRPKVDEELDRLWNLHFEDQLDEEEDRFLELSDELNKQLEGESIPDNEDKQQAILKTINEIADFLEELEFSPDEIEGVFRIKAYPDVLKLYLDKRDSK